MGKADPTVDTPRVLCSAQTSTANKYTIGLVVDNVRFMPRWWNWQTRWTQNPLPERACGFKSRSRHQGLEPRRRWSTTSRLKFLHEVLPRLGHVNVDVVSGILRFRERFWTALVRRHNRYGPIVVVILVVATRCPSRVRVSICGAG